MKFLNSNPGEDPMHTGAPRGGGQGPGLADPAAEQRVPEVGGLLGWHGDDHLLRPRDSWGFIALSYC